MIASNWVWVKWLSQFFQKPGLRIREHRFCVCSQACVGVLVGVFEGGSGVLVGVSVGVFVGVSVGVLVGVSVGVLVGVSVGVLVGVSVGVYQSDYVCPDFYLDLFHKHAVNRSVPGWGSVSAGSRRLV